MGRTEPSYAPVAQQSFRKDQRAKQARATINKIIPQILSSDSRVRRGIDNAQLISSKPCDASRGPKDDRKHQNRRSSDAVAAESAKVGRSDKASLSEAAPQEDNSTSANVRIRIADTLEVARDLYQDSRSKKNVAVLNMASPLRPGGGVLNGATSQEESLCSRTTLLPSLREEWYRLPEVGGIWSPDVLVFRLPSGKEDEELSKSNRFYIDVVSAAMTRFPEIVKDAIATDGADEDETDEEEGVEILERYANQKDRDLALEKMRRVLDILVSHRSERVVLGAWGCGAYGNPTNEIAKAWKRALLGSSKKRRDQPSNLSSLKEIVFAIKDHRMAKDFARAWGDGIEMEHEEKRTAQTADAAQQEEHIEELTQKIEVLELQLAEVKTPMLKQSLEGTLAALKRDLARVGKEASEDEEEEEDDV